MPRVTNQKTRQYKFVVDEALDGSLPVDNIALFLPDGTPINLTADPSKMKWLGNWSATTVYIQNDVVYDTVGKGLYIALNPVIAAGGTRPSTPNAAWQLVFQAPPAGGFKGEYSGAVTYPAGSIVTYQGSVWATTVDIPSGGNPPNELPDAISLTLGIAGPRTIGRYIPGSTWPSLGTTDASNNAYRYFDLTVGGDVTFPSNGVSIIYAGWTGTGTFTYANFSGVKTLTAGRWIFSAGSAGLPAGPLALSNGAVFQSNYPPNWTLIAKALPAGGLAGDLLQKATGADRDVSWTTRPLPVIGTRAARISISGPSVGRLYKESDTGLTYIGNGTGWDLWDGSGVIRRTSDFTLPQSDTTISGSGDIYLQLITEASGIYLVEGLLRLQGVSQLADIKVDIGTGGSYEMLKELDALGVPAGSAPVLVSTGTPLEYGLDNGITYAKFTALITCPSFSQTANFRAAQVTSQAENVKILTNSMLKVKRLA